MPPLLAQSEMNATAIVIGIVVIGLSSLASVGVSLFTLIRMSSGKDAERQIEPTALHAITSELKAQTLTLNKLDRESGEISIRVENVVTEMGTLRGDVKAMELNVFKRVNAISSESTRTVTRVDGLEDREKSKKS